MANLKSDFRLAIFCIKNRAAIAIIVAIIKENSYNCYYISNYSNKEKLWILFLKHLQI